MIKLVVAMVAVVLLTTLAAAETGHGDVGSVRVQMSGFESEAGVAVCALFTKDGWLQTGKGQARRVPIRDRRATCDFAGVPYGTYAVAAYHDEDSDGEFDRRLGVPVEDYCFSNGATPRRLKPPSFESAKFEHGRAETQQLCELR